MANPTEAASVFTDKEGNFRVGPQQALITPADEAHSLTDADANLGATTQAEIEAVLNALGVAVNACMAVLEINGDMADT